MSFEIRDGKPVIVMDEHDKRLWTEEDPKMMILNLEERDQWIEWEKKNAIHQKAS